MVINRATRKKKISVFKSIKGKAFGEKLGKLESRLMIFNGNVKSTINAQRVTREVRRPRIIARRDSKNREIKPEGLIGDDRREKACWRTNSPGIIKKEREREREEK